MKSIDTRPMLVLVLIVLLCIRGERTNADHHVLRNITCRQEDISTWHERWYISYEGTKCQSTCPKQCTCILGPNRVTSNCTNESVSQSEIPYPSNVRYLNWNGSTLHKIRKDAFTRFLQSLKGLLLSNVNLMYLQPGVFDSLSYLCYLNLSNNNLPDIATGTFGGLNSLWFLDLSKNNLTGLATRTFMGISSLSELYISNNKLTDIATNTFSALSYLSLWYLDLSNNNLTDLATGTFSGLNFLAELYLSNNNLADLATGTFSGLNSLAELYLSNNN